MLIFVLFVFNTVFSLQWFFLFYFSSLILDLCKKINFIPFAIIIKPSILGEDDRKIKKTASRKLQEERK